MLVSFPVSRSRKAYRPAGIRGLMYVLGGLAVATYVRSHPYQARLRAAIRSARLLQHARRALNEPPTQSHADRRDRALGVVFRALHYWGVLFPVAVRFEGDPIPPGPMLVLVWHLPFNQIVIRPLLEQGVSISALRSKPPQHGRALGSRLPFETILAGPMALRAVAKRLRESQLVLVAPDAGVSVPTHRRRVPTASGTWFVADAPIRLAVRMRVPVGFLIGVADNDTIVGRFRRARSTDPDGILEEYAAWLDASRVVSPG
jgi:hypothetical protein